MKLNIFPQILNEPNTVAFHPYCINLYEHPPENVEFVQEYDNNQDPKPYQEFVEKFKAECRKNNIAEEHIEKYIESTNIKLSKTMKYGIPIWSTTLATYFGPNDWIIEIEDGWSLFYPFSGNAENSDYDLTENNWLVKVLKVLLEMDNCKGILTHIKDTINFLEIVFGQKVLSKTMFLQQSVNIPDDEVKFQLKTTNHTRFLFHGGSVHTPEHFFLRGGFETLHAFAHAYDKNPNIHLTVIYDIDSLSDILINVLQNHPGITYVTTWQSDSQMAEHRRNADVYLIPAFRIHCMSTLMSMARGNPVICSDGWGFDEYVYHNYTGLIAKGQKCSWKDSNGLFRESYKLGRGILQPTLVKNVTDCILKLSTNLNFYNTLRMNCVNEYYKNYTNDLRNQTFANILNKLYA